MAQLNKAMLITPYKIDSLCPPTWRLHTYAKLKIDTGNFTRVET